MSFLQPISILLEVVVILLGLLLALAKKKSYGWGFVFTFGIYVVYDSAKFFALNFPADGLNIAFFLSTLSILWAVWQIAQEKN
jgi:type IV secretory pathway VirB2 component (pilin)